MKTLIITMVLALGLAYHLTSSANESDINILLPKESYEVKEDAKLDYVPFDFLDAFNVQKSTKPGYANEVESQDDRDYFYAIGIPFNFIDQI